MSTQQFSLRWNNYTTYITGAFESLRYEEDLVDVTLCCEGKKIRAHKILLSACSAYFKEIFKENPCQHPVIIFKNVKYTDLLAIVEFMYQGEVSVIQESLPSFLHTAELLSIRGLTDNTTDTRQQQQQQQHVPSQIQQHIIQTQDQNLLQKTITTAESVYLTLPSNSTIVHQPAKLIQTQPQQAQIINKTIIKPVEILQQVSTASGQSIVSPITTQTLTAKIQTTQTDYSDLNQHLKRKKIKLHQNSEGDIYETTETTYTVAKAESDDNQMTGDEQTVEEEYQETSNMKMEIQEYIDASQINDQLNSSNAGSTTYIPDESYELVAEGISIEKDPNAEDDGTMQHDDSGEIEQSEMDMNRLLQGTSEEQKSNILQVATNIDERKHFKCNQCSRLFCSMNAMKRHQLSKHNDQKTSYICSICNAVFKTKWSMSTHKSKYHREKMLVVDSQTGATVQVQEQRLFSAKKTKKLDITGTIKEEIM